MNATIGRWSRARIAMCGLAFIGLSAFVARRAFELQVSGGERMRGLAEDNYLREIQIPPGRGRILDRNGKELAATIEVQSVFANPRVLAHVPGAAARLSAALHLETRTVIERLTPTTGGGEPRFFSWVKRRVSPDEARAVAALDLPGVGFRPEPRRFYPLRNLGSTVIGYAGSDGRGLEGVELGFDDTLRGQAATLHGIRDALGRELMIDGIADTSEVAGLDVTLSLDSYLTLVTETALARAVEEQHARAAMAVMLDPRTGQILVLASVPGFNPNQPEQAARAEARNRAITDTFEPGSTMKTFTFAAALEGRRIRPDEPFDCEMGRMKIGRYTITDTHPLGIATAAEAYQQSSNICTVKIARRVGKDALFAMLSQFGFGRLTGVGLPGERRGIVRPPEQWGEIGLATVAFGQGITATPLQITAGFAAIASGGVYRPPRLGLRVQRPDGSVEEPARAPDAPGERRVISLRAARELIAIMAGVPTEHGTARLAAVSGYRVAGKTGTAQKVSGGVYDPDKWLSSFIGFAPVEDPRFVLSVFIDEPRPVHLGGKVAAPVFREIAEATLKYMNIPPSQPAGPRPEGGVGVDPAPPGGPAAAIPPEDASDGDAADGADEGPGSDAYVLSEEEFFPVDPALPEAGQQGPVSVPDVAGMSIGRAIAEARRAGLDLIAEGSGSAVGQTPGAGREVRRGATLRVTFKPAGG